MKTLELYEVRQNSDLTEGRGPMVTKGYFTRQEDAAKAAKDLPGVMGHGHGDYKPYTLIVYDSYDEWKQGQNDALRAQALKKLTPAERRALGL